MDSYYRNEVVITPYIIIQNIWCPHTLFTRTLVIVFVSNKIILITYCTVSKHSKQIQVQIAGLFIYLDT